MISPDEQKHMEERVSEVANLLLSSEDYACTIAMAVVASLLLAQVRGDTQAYHALVLQTVLPALLAYPDFYDVKEAQLQ